MKHLRKSRIMRTVLGTALFVVVAFGLTACPEEGPAGDDDPAGEEEPADDGDDAY